MIPYIAAALGGYLIANASKKFASGGIVGKSRRSIPNVRGGWTKDKILRYLKQHPSDTTSTYTLVKYISEFDNWQQFKEHIYYHGTKNYIDDGLKPSIVFSERFAEGQGGGGYGERYWGISLTKRKRTAESFSGVSRSVTIYPVILKKDAKVIHRTDLEDSSEIEDIIIDLYEDGVDAVWIGGGEEELVVVNPYSILLYKNGSQTFNVFGGFKSNNLTDEEIKHIYETADELWKKYKSEFSSKTTKDEKNEYTRNLPKIKFSKGGIVFDNWVMPSINQLKLEYKVEHELKGNSFFESEQDFLDAVENASVVQVTPEMDDSISYRSRTKSYEELISLIRGYKSYPQFRNEKTVQSIYDGFQTNKEMDYPIVLQFKDGKKRILSGNTRMDIAFQLGINPKVLLIKL